MAIDKKKPLQQLSSIKEDKFQLMKRKNELLSKKKFYNEEINRITQELEKIEQILKMADKK